MAGYGQGQAGAYYGSAPPQQPYGAQQSYGAPSYQQGPPQNAYGGGPAQHGYGQAPPPQQQGYGQPAYGAQSGGYQQHGGPPPSGPRPSPGDDQLRSWFMAVDQDRSGAISVAELSNALVNGNWSPFEPATVQMLMDLFDVDRSGTINMQEFSGLWRYIEQWQGIFRNADRDGSGSISAPELEGALRQFGFPLSPQLVQTLTRKFVAGQPKGQATPFAGARAPSLTFDVFVRCCVTVKALSETFRQADTNGSGWAQISYEQFLSMALKAP